MTPSDDRLDRIEGILEGLSYDHKQVAQDLAAVNAILKEMAARQRYHDEAFERFDARMKIIQENQAIDTENIRALARIAEHHNRRLEGLEGPTA